jgi:hypothetical protein
MTPRRTSSPQHHPEGQRVHSAIHGCEATVHRMFPEAHGKGPSYMIDRGAQHDARYRFVIVPESDLRPA